MNHRKSFALAAACSALAVLPAGSALAAAPAKVTVRVEGKNRTLLPARTVRTRSGFITRDGAPAGACPAGSAAGALDTATRHRWGAKFDSSFNDYELTTILGETWKFTSPNFWGVWVNDRFASTGICEIKLRAGDQVLFAADPAKHPEKPLGLRGPARPKLGHPLRLQVVAFSNGGVAKPLAGAHVHGSGVNAMSDAHGRVTIQLKGKGPLTFRADKPGFIRAAALHVKVV